MSALPVRCWVRQQGEETVKQIHLQHINHSLTSKERTWSLEFTCRISITVSPHSACRDSWRMHAVSIAAGSPKDVASSAQHANTLLRVQVHTLSYAPPPPLSRTPRVCFGKACTCVGHFQNACLHTLPTCQQQSAMPRFILCTIPLHIMTFETYDV